MDLKKILILAERSKLGDKLENAFIHANFYVTRTDDPAWSIKLLQHDNPQAIIVDWDMANGTINEITRIIREKCKKTALVLITRTRDTEERIHALEKGADECIVHPDAMDELIAKVKALIRRIEIVDHEPRIMKIKDIVINLDTHEVMVGNRSIDLTHTQFRILHLLCSEQDYVFTRNEILKNVWGQNAYVTDRTVDVHVKRLREKLSEGKQSSKYIHTIHGLGYRFA